jgi:hypothetical protein
MSKLSRTVLKEIVKECIIEILEESFFTQGDMIYESNKSYSGDDISNNQNHGRSKKPRSRRNDSSHKQTLDNARYANNNQPVNKLFEQKVDKITSNLTKDPIMADIFKDTASTTLQQQNNAVNSRGLSVTGGGDAADYQVSKSDPTELFAESAGKWATLAFSDPVIKR